MNPAAPTMTETINPIKHYQIILASRSPRRQHLLRELGLEFEIRTKDTDEDFDPNMDQAKIAPYLAEKKAAPFLSELSNDELLITADTIVCLGDEVLNKPGSVKE